jgi:hypothetical protein
LVRCIKDICLTYFLFFFIDYKKILIFWFNIVAKTTMEEHRAWTLKDNGWKEIIEDCELNHKKLIHGNITIHLVECGNLNGDLVSY